MTDVQRRADPGPDPEEIGAPRPPRKRRRDATAAEVPSRRILGMRVDATRYDAVTGAVLERARRRQGGMVCVASVHMVMECHADPELRRVVNGAEFVTPDGMPLVWGLRCLGIPGARRVYGPELTDTLCRRATAEGVTVGFYGGAPEVLDALVPRLVERHPGLRVAFHTSPPFRPLTPEEDQHVIAAIRESGVQVLFVGLGCPKQERWMAAHRDAVDCVMLGVGAAFDFLAGAKPQAPRWMQVAGLEWLFRLAWEPRRLWRRYLLLNPRFVARFALQLLGELLGGPGR
jgi:N-acetylglucosaminyldiphosphoundecaprenol N-acetyl-beta-D-mannosaminyltransferase